MLIWRKTLTKYPFAYVCAPGKGGNAAELNNIREYCRQLFEAGYLPLAPALLFPQFLNMRAAKERQAAVEMSHGLLRRCRVVVACGPKITEEMVCDLMLARRLNILATTLDGILVIQQQKPTPQDKGKVTH